MKRARLFAVLSIALLVPNSLLYSFPSNLSPESKQFILTSAISGGIIGGGLGLIAAFLNQSNSTKQPKTLWGKIKAFPWSYVVIPTLAGAAGAGFASTFF